MAIHRSSGCPDFDVGCDQETTKWRVLPIVRTLEPAVVASVWKTVEALLPDGACANRNDSRMLEPALDAVAPRRPPCPYPEPDATSAPDSCLSLPPTLTMTSDGTGEHAGAASSGAMRS